MESPQTDPLPNLSNRTALVTGSTQNLGYTTALLFAQAGARVIVHGQKLDAAQEALQKIQEQVPQARLHAIAFELGSETEIRNAFADLAERRLAPDILVNNAAHLGLGKDTSFLGQDSSFFKEVFDINLHGVFLCSQLAARLLRDAGKPGAIINITSLAGERPIWGRSAYNASKAALEGLTRSMAIDLAKYKIRTNCISAGYIWTPRWNAISEETTQRRYNNIPGGAPTYQEEIGRLALFLASGQAPSLLGSRIVIDGGMHVQQIPHDVGG